MNFKIQFSLLVLFGVESVYSFNNEVTLIAGKNKWANSMIVFPLYDMIQPSLEMALSSCQESFKWDRWNCPSSDFLSKRNSQIMDREAAYVRALATAALIYKITKNCSTGAIPGCGCSESEILKSGICSDDPSYAEELVGEIFNLEQHGVDAQAYTVIHNNRAGRLAVRNSLRRSCRCKDILKSCSDEICWTTMKPFTEIAADIRLMYDRALLLKVQNSGAVNWKEIPLNVLAYVHVSPNYCQINAIPGWNGMQGRQCSRDKMKSMYERRSCKTLCRDCGLRVRSEITLSKRRCNCKFTWCCEVRCDICESKEKKFFCE